MLDKLGNADRIGGADICASAGWDQTASTNRHAESKVSLAMG
jgi:hypothetical protein